jgi:hypothetical protein
MLWLRIYLRVEVLIYPTYLTSSIRGGEDLGGWWSVFKSGAKRLLFIVKTSTTSRHTIEAE